MRVSVWLGIELWLGLIEGQQKGPDYVLGMFPGITMAGQGPGMGKASKQLVIHAQLSSSEPSCEVMTCHH